MKITIDTKEDSHEEIKKVISLLSHLIESGSVESKADIFGDNDPGEPSSDEQPSGNAFTNLFGSSDETSASQVQENDSEEKKEEDNPEIIEY